MCHTSTPSGPGPHDEGVEAAYHANGYEQGAVNLLTNAEIAPAAPTFEGDVNGDGTVDILDLVTLMTYFGSNNPAGDLNGDGVVDILDMTLAAQHFGNALP